MAASDDAFREAVPDGECSHRIVVPAAMQELGCTAYVRACDHLPEIGRRRGCRTIGGALKTRTPCLLMIVI